LPANFSWGVFALGFALAILFVRLLAPNFFWRTFTPVFHASDALASESHFFLSGFGNTATLAVQRERLAQENVALTNENQALLQKIADLKALSLSPGIPAGVVARPPESPYDTLVLAAGRNAGVALGMEAFGNGGVPIGTISSVLDDFSRVTLFSAPGVQTGGWVGHAALPLTIQGMGAGAMQATVSRSAPIAVGDTVFVPGPGMLPIGTVVRIDSDSSSPGVTVRIQSALNLFSIVWVTLRSTGAAVPLL